MRWFAAFIGVVLILLGVLAFTGQFPGKMFSFTSTSEQTDTQQLKQSDPGNGGGVDVDVTIPGSSESESTQRNSFPLAPVLGVIAVLGGLILVGKAMSKREHVDHHHHRDVHVS